MKFGDLNKVRHGGARQIKFENCTESVIDFSASLNPFPPEIGWNSSNVSISEYPDDSYPELKEAISKNFRCRPDEVCVGNGSIEIIRSFFQAVLERGDAVLTDPHTFGEYDLSIRLAGGFSTVDAGQKYAFRVICNPNNPTGSLISRKEMLEIVDIEKSSGRRIFIDEAFMDLADTNESLIDSRSEGTFISRSITKSFAVPGIRFGFGIGDPDLIERIEIARTPWGVNSYACYYFLLAMKNYDKLEKSRKLIRYERDRICDTFNSLGIRYFPPHANFILIKTPVSASDLTSDLLSHGIFVRDCTSFGLSDCIRIAVRNTEENNLFLEALKSCLHL